MVKVEEIEGQNAVNVISDDALSENAKLDDSIDLVAPHLYADLKNTQVNDEGLLVWRVERSEFESLLEVLENLDDIDPDEQEAAVTLVEKLHGEVI
jgi:hypothetical protein